jgi:hypothetical protein
MTLAEGKDMNAVKAKWNSVSLGTQSSAGKASTDDLVL